MFLHAYYCPWWMAASQSPFGREIQRNFYRSAASARIDQWFCVPWSTDWWYMFFLYIGNNHPNWLSYFQRGWNHQPVKSYVFAMFIGMVIKSCSSGFIHTHHTESMMGGDMQQSRVLTLAPNWLVAWNIYFFDFPFSWECIIPTDFHFSDGWKSPTRL